MSADEETRPLHELTTPEEPTMDDTADMSATTDPDHHQEAAHPHAPRDVRPVSLVLGVLYLAVVAVWGLGQSALLGVDDLGLVVPVMLLVAGLAGLAGLATRRRDR